MVICGLPLSSVRDQDDTEDGVEIPVGTVPFQQRYLSRRFEQLQTKARVLEGVADGIPSVGKHVALEILHCCLLASCVYLLRGLACGRNNAFGLFSVIPCFNKCGCAFVACLVYPPHSGNL